MPVKDPVRLLENRLTAIRDYHQSCGLKRAQLDLSGGVDSSVMAGLLVSALGPENVTLVYSSITSSESSRDRARLVAEAFSVGLVEIELSQIYEDLVETMKESLVVAYGRDAVVPTAVDSDCVLNRIEQDETILGSIRSTLRAPVGRGYNRLMGGGIRHGTGNECEDRWLRFYQKGGDGEVDTNPIAMLAKGEVYQLGIALGVPREVLEATPSPDLWGRQDDHNDEDEIADFIGIRHSELQYYSYVKSDGRYRNVGLIERVSRFLDRLGPGDETEESLLFTDTTSEAELERLYERAAEAPEFRDLSSVMACDLLQAAKLIEKKTRHKFNPGIPTLGDREPLLVQGILTNELPI